MIELVVAATGTANLASVWAGLERIGARPRLAESAGDIRGAERLVLPGVGTYRAAMRRLEHDGLVDAIRDHVKARKSTLAVCLGFQLLFASSEESPGVAGLGVWPHAVRSLPRDARRPHLGWNDVRTTTGTRWLTDGEAYFAHSFWVEPQADLPHRAETSYGRAFIAAVEDGGILATQFHPELSGPWGLELVASWLRRS